MTEQGSRFFGDPRKRRGEDIVELVRPPRFAVAEEVLAVNMVAVRCHHGAPEPRDLLVVQLLTTVLAAGEHPHEHVETSRVLRPEGAEEDHVTLLMRGLAVELP